MFVLRIRKVSPGKALHRIYSTTEAVEEMVRPCLWSRRLTMVMENLECKRETTELTAQAPFLLGSRKAAALPDATAKGNNATLKLQESARAEVKHPQPGRSRLPAPARSRRVAGACQSLLQEARFACAAPRCKLHPAACPRSTGTGRAVPKQELGAGVTLCHVG